MQNSGFWGFHENLVLGQHWHPCLETLGCRWAVLPSADGTCISSLPVPMRRASFPYISCSLLQEFATLPLKNALTK